MIFRFEMRVQSSNNTQNSVLENTGDLLEKLKKRDKDTVIVSHHDDNIRAYTKLQLPKDLKDLK